MCTWSHLGGGQSLTALLHEVVSCSLHVFQRDNERVNVCTYSMCCLCSIRLFAEVVCHVDVDVMLEEQCVCVVRIMLLLVLGLPELVSPLTLFIRIFQLLELHVCVGCHVVAGQSLIALFVVQQEHEQVCRTCRAV